VRKEWDWEVLKDVNNIIWKVGREEIEERLKNCRVGRKEKRSWIS
jgi:ribosomal protein L31E